MTGPDRLTDLGFRRDELPAELGELRLQHPQVGGGGLVLLCLGHLRLNILDLLHDIHLHRLVGGLKGFQSRELCTL